MLYSLAKLGNQAIDLLLQVIPFVRATLYIPQQMQPYLGLQCGCLFFHCGEMFLLSLHLDSDHSSEQELCLEVPLHHEQRKFLVLLQKFGLHDG